MSDIKSEPALAPFVDSPAEKRERVRAGRGLAPVIGIIAVMFMVASFGIIGQRFFAATA